MTDYLKRIQAEIYISIQQLKDERKNNEDFIEFAATTDSDYKYAEERFEAIDQQMQEMKDLREKVREIKENR